MYTRGMPEIRLLFSVTEITYLNEQMFCLQLVQNPDQ